MNRDDKLEELQKRIGYRFRDTDLLTVALTHSSYAYERHLPKYRCNERLEFLGDAVLELVSSEFLFSADGRMPEGELTRTRASLVCEPALAFCAKNIRLGSCLLLGRGETASGGRRRDSVTSDALEALIGAIYLDGGFPAAKKFVRKFVLNDAENRKLFNDSKTSLQEIVQGGMKGEISYRLLREEGPDHDKLFFVAVYIDGICYGEGSGRTKKSAEQQAACHAISNLRKTDTFRVKDVS